MLSSKLVTVLNVLSFVLLLVALALEVLDAAAFSVSPLDLFR